MKNLAGRKDCDIYIKDELERAGIEIITVPLDTIHYEVPFTLEGIINNHKLYFQDPIKLWRAWTYWVIEGNINLEVAWRIYKHPEGKASVRAFGNCGGISPDGHGMKFLDKETKSILVSTLTYEKWKKELSPLMLKSFDDRILCEDFKIVDDPKEVGFPVVQTYHIDTQAGLLLFALIVSGKLLV